MDNLIENAAKKLEIRISDVDACVPLAMQKRVDDLRKDVRILVETLKAWNEAMKRNEEIRNKFEGYKDLIERAIDFADLVEAMREIEKWARVDEFVVVLDRRFKEISSSSFEFLLTENLESFVRTLPPLRKGNKTHVGIGRPGKDIIPKSESGSFLAHPIERFFYEDQEDGSRKTVRELIGYFYFFTRDETRFDMNVGTDLFDGFARFFSNKVKDLIKESTLTRGLTHDLLTGAGSRYYLDSHFKKNYENCQRMGKIAGLVFFDLDKFKAVNDVLGHDCGDKILKEFCRVFPEFFRREMDELARYGGDEFISLSFFDFVLDKDKTEDEQATEFQNRIKEIREGLSNSLEAFRKKFEETDLEAVYLSTLPTDREMTEEEKKKQALAREMKVSFSYGIVLSTEEGSMERAKKLADKEMYDEKEARKTAAGKK